MEQCNEVVMEHVISLPIEVAEPILVQLVRVFTLPAAKGSSKTIRPALDTLSRTLVPDVTRVAVKKLWWYSVDDIPPCSTSWLLPMLLDLETRQGRPLLYSVAGFGNAARRGDSAVMNAWLAAGLLDDSEDIGALHLARHEAAKGEHYIEVCKWWLKHGLPWGGADVIEQDFVLVLSHTCDEAECLQAFEWWRTQEWHTLVTVPPSVLAAASGRGFLGILEWWNAQPGSISGAPEVALVEASRHGHVHVLQWWWMHFESSVKCTATMIDVAIEGGGHLHVLEWWVSKFPLSSPGENDKKKNKRVNVLNNVADLASRHGHVHILQWWFDQVSVMSKSYHKRTEAAIDHAAAHGHIAVLDFWLKCSKHPNPHQRMSLKFKNALNLACGAFRLAVLEWFSTHAPSALANLAVPCPFAEFSDEYASSISIDCLAWRLKRSVPTCISHKGTHALCTHGRLDVLEWLAHNEIEYQFDSHALARASQAGHVAILDFFMEQRDHGRVHWSGTTWAGGIVVTHHMPVLQWWVHAQEKQLSQLRGPPVSPPLDCPTRVEWAISHGVMSAESAIQQCIARCSKVGDYATMAWCLQAYPDQAMKELHLAKMVDWLDQVQFGIIEFLDMHQLLPDYQFMGNVLATMSEYGARRLLKANASLPLVDWIHSQLQRRHSALTLPFNWTDEASRRSAAGDLGFCRWTNRKKLLP